MKKINNWGEMGFVLGTVFIAFGVALMTKGNLGMSMVVSPAYLVSLKISGLTFGTAEYMLQGLLLIGYYLMLGRFEWKNLFSFGSAFVYGLVLDGILFLMRGLAPVGMPARVAYFIVGLLFNSLGVTFFFRTYLPYQIYELFVKGMSDRFRLPLPRAKLIFDYSFCALAICMSLLFFGELRGVGIGTVACAICNNKLIGFYGKYIDKYIDFSPACKKLYSFFSPPQKNRVEKA